MSENAVAQLAALTEKVLNVEKTVSDIRITDINDVKQLLKEAINSVSSLRNDVNIANQNILKVKWDQEKTEEKVSVLETRQKELETIQEKDSGRIASLELFRYGLNVRVATIASVAATIFAIITPIIQNLISTLFKLK